MGKHIQIISRELKSPPSILDKPKPTLSWW